MKAAWGRVAVPMCAAVAALSFVSLSSANNGRGDLSRIRVKNFGVVCDTLYRGAQPKRGDYQDLAALGIKSVLDLQSEGERAEQGEVEATGMKFYRVGMSDKSWPTVDQVEAFFKIVDDPANQPVFMHCHGGHHRTGIMSAIYRIKNDHWDIERACQEMDQYGFNTGLGHGGLKDFVRDYYARQASAKQSTPSQAVTDTATTRP